jgi:hypothetical protein
MRSAFGIVSIKFANQHLEFSFCISMRCSMIPSLSNAHTHLAILHSSKGVFTGIRSPTQSTSAAGADRCDCWSVFFSGMRWGHWCPGGRWQVRSLGLREIEGEDGPLGLANEWASIDPSIHWVLKLLHAGIIYHVPYSEWVSPVQVVPKKEGMTVVRNEKNELVSQRTITSWRMCIDYRKLNKQQRRITFHCPSLMKCWID